MRVAFEVDYAGAGARGGTHAITHLMVQYGRLAPRDEFLIFGFFYKDFAAKVRQLSLPQCPNVRVGVKRWPQSLVTRLEWGAHLPIIERHLAREEVDVYDCFRAPPRGYKKLVVRGADASQILYPEWHSAAGMRAWEEVLEPGLHKADAIIAYCKTQKDDLVRVVGIPPEKIVVTYPGVDLELFRPDLPKDRLEETRANFKLPARYFVMVGPFDMAMNYDGVFEALAAYARKSGERPPVVCIGGVDDYARGLQARADKAGVGAQFQWIGHLPHSLMAPVMAQAEGLIYPTFYPGFEMPPMEALACGLALITSANEAIDERGECGLLVDPKSPAELSAAIAKVWESPELRAALRGKGVKRAAAFTWEQMARDTLAVYRKVLG